MTTDIENWELARTIERVHCLFHRRRLQHVHDAVGGDSVPALTPSQMTMLMTIRENGSMTIKHLTQALQVKAPSVSAMVERLVEMGILTREENPMDRREVLVRISPGASVAMEQIERRMLCALVDILDQIGPEYSRMWSLLSHRLLEILTQDNTP